MAQQIEVKYVGPMDTKVFRGYHFTRDVSDDASGGLNAVALPDAIANEALKHRDVFMQAHQKVPQHVKELRLKLPEAHIKEAEHQRKHWLKRQVAAENLPEDNPRQVAIKDGEVAGATAQVEHWDAKLVEAHQLRKALREEHLAAGGAPVWEEWAKATPAKPAAPAADALAEFRQAFQNLAADNASLRAELQAMRDHMARDGRLDRSEPPTPPSVAAFDAGAANGEVVPLAPGEETDDAADLKADGWEEIGGDAEEAEAEAPAEAPATIERAPVRRRRAEG